MSSLNGLLNIGTSAMNSHQRRIQTVQQNIANASTPGYQRQRVNLEASMLGGVTIGNQQSISSNFLDRQLQYQRSTLGYNQSRSEVGLAVEMAINPMDGTDIASKLDAFFASASTLGSNPAGMVERRDMVASAQQLSHGFQRASQILNDTQQGTQQQAEGLVDKINASLQRIDELDKNIAQAKGSGQHPGELISTRNQVIAELSEDFSIRLVPSDNENQTQIFTPEGRPLLEGGQVHRVSINKDSTSGDLELILNGNQPISAQGGKLGGLISAHNEIIGDQLQALDQIAYEFATAFNSTHQTGFALDGSTGNDFFTPLTGPDGAASLISVDDAIINDPGLIAASDTAGQSGNNVILLQLVALQDQNLPGGQTPGNTLRSLTQTLGNQLRSAEDGVDAAATSLFQLESLESSISGVSLEEEMVSLMEAQRAYEASAKMIQTTSEMLDVVMSLK